MKKTIRIDFSSIEGIERAEKRQARLVDGNYHLVSTTQTGFDTFELIYELKMENFEIAFFKWLEKAVEVANCDLQVKRGRRYYRIVKEGYTFCFVDLTNGNVLKAASWRSPAKHARGNIYTDNIGVSEFGAFYMYR